MSGCHYDRLSAQDASFLVFEGTNTHMHIAGTTIFEAGPLTASSGGIDIDRIRDYISSRLHLIPRYRQRLAWIPFADHPVWVDDDRFNIRYHVRHTSLPRPGGERQLKRLSARIMSQQLDRGKPLWEAWVIEGLKGGRFAMITKIHHCVIDGVSGVDLLAVLMSMDPDGTIHDPPLWIPRPAPTPADLVRDEVIRRASLPLQLAGTARRVLEDPDEVREQVSDAVGAVWDTLKSGLRSSDDTPLNGPIGSYRRFDWLEIDLAEVKDVKNQLGGNGQRCRADHCGRCAAEVLRSPAIQLGAD